MKGKFELYKEVQLIKPLPENGFVEGDIATLVDIVKDKAGSPGYILEFFDSNGDTLEVLPVPEDYIGLPPKHAIVNYRPYKAA